MKNIRIYSMVILILSISVLVLVGCSNDTSVITIKLSHDLLENTPQHVGALAFKSEVETKSEGRIKVEIFPAGQLGSDVEVTEMMQLGTIQAGLVPTAKLSGFAPELQIVDLPFIFESRDIAYAVLDSEFKNTVFEPLLEKKLKGIAFWESGFKQFTSNFDISSPNDLMNRKIRVMESPMLIEQYKMVGANPTPIDFSETYNALQQGVVEMQENPLVSIVNMKFYEVQDVLTMSNHGYLAYAFLLSKDFWDGLSETDQEIVESAAMNAAKVEREETIASEEVYLQTIKDSGTVVNEIDDAQRAAFINAWQPLKDDYTHILGADLMDQLDQAIKDAQQN